MEKIKPVSGAYIGNGMLRWKNTCFYKSSFSCRILLRIHNGRYPTGAKEKVVEGSQVVWCLPLCKYATSGSVYVRH